MKPKTTGIRGSRHAPPTNAFQPGNKGGPGRPRMTDEEREAREMVMRFQPEAVRLLMEHARGEDKRLSIDALKHLTPWLSKMHLEVTGEGGGPVQTLALDPAKLTGAQLSALLAALPTEGGDHE